MSFSSKTLLWVLMVVLPVLSRAQQLQKVEETAAYTEYVFRNDSARVRPAYSLLADRFGDEVRFTLSDVASVPVRRAPVLPPASGWTAVRNPGMYRKNPVATLELHTLVQSGGEQRVLTRARLRIQKNRASGKTVFPARVQASASPFASGDWYKIPISRPGIHQLNRAYLQNLGIRLEGLNPALIQIWAGPGFELPRENAVARPDFRQIPILVEGGADGSFDAADRILFFQNDPNRMFFNTASGRFEHQLHTGSTRNYVFLTIGTEAGLRLNDGTVPAGTPTEVTTFTDAVWKEEERTKPEADLKSGTQWLGQTLSVQRTGFTTVFSDTLPGFQSGPVTFDVGVASRHLGASARFVFYVNGIARDSVSVSSIESFTDVLGPAARPARRIFTTTVNAPEGIVSLGIQVRHSNEFSTTGFVDYVRMWAERPLQAERNAVMLYETRGAGEAARYRFSQFGSAPLAMDVTNPLQPVRIPVTGSGAAFEAVWTRRAGQVLAVQSAFHTPAPGVKMAGQNLRGVTGYPDMVIVTSQPLFEKAAEFAAYRAQTSGLDVVVVTQDQVFNEFSAGVPDYAAIRDYLRYLYNRATVTSQLPEYLLLFGDATFDFKGIESSGSLKNHVFSYQTLESYDRIGSYGSDDFFGLLDDSEGNWDTQPYITTNRVDLGIGRFPVQTVAEADIMIRKIKAYERADNLADWRTVFTFVSDDDVSGSKNDRDLHLINADVVAESIARDEAGVRLQKIHALNYQAQTTAQGRRIPDATNDMIEAVNAGTLVLSYSGHGNERTLSDEKIFDADYNSRFTNKDRYAVFVTATCSFGRFDDSEAQSGAEQTVLLPDAGMVAAFTTTRTVFTSWTPGNDNFGLNLDLTEHMTSRPSGGAISLGDIYRLTKNGTPGASLNGRKFILLGDPSMRFGLPALRATVDSINGLAVSATPVTLKALDRVRISGSVAVPDQTPFNGTLQVTVFDGLRTVPYAEKSWTAGACGAGTCSYFVQNDILFRGQATVTNGKFTATFLVPKDIQFSSASGRIHVYAAGGGRDAAGGTSAVRFNGISETAVNDGQGPDVQVFLNDTTFVDGGLVNNRAQLVVRLSDQAGINTAGAGVGHELTARLSTNPETILPLNRSYSSKPDDFRAGTAAITLPDLAPGAYSATVRAWDVFNNMTETAVRFRVGSTAALELANMYNYPNPMSGFTRFMFEHNLPAGTSITAVIRIFTLSGRPVAVLKEDLLTTGNIEQIPWDGTDSDGGRLANGTYLYHVSLSADTPGGPLRSSRIEKLVILR